MPRFLTSDARSASARQASEPRIRRRNPRLLQVLAQERERLGVGREDLQARLAAGRDRIVDVDAGDDRQVEHAADRGAHGLGVEQVGAEVLQMRAHKVAEIESLSATPAPFDRPSDVHRLLTESNGVPAPLGSSSSHADVMQQMQGHHRPSEPPRPPSAHPGTLSSSASYVGLPAATPAPKRGNTVAIVSAICALVLFLGFGSLVVVSRMKAHAGEDLGKPDAEAVSTVDLYDAGEVVLNLDDAGGAGTVIPQPGVTATATAEPTSKPTASASATTKAPHWVPVGPGPGPATAKPTSTGKAPAVDPCTTNPYFFEDGIKKVRPECRNKL